MRVEMPADEATLAIEIGTQVVNLAPGDRLDLGEHGLIVWYDGVEASAIRMQFDVRARTVRSAVEYAIARHDARARGR